MKKCVKRLLGLALSVAMAVSLLPAALTTAVYAAESDFPLPETLQPTTYVTESVGSGFLLPATLTPSALTVSAVSTSGSSKITNA